MKSNKPDNFTLIIGAMKSGTTSLFEILSQHPQIIAANKKEPNYFVKDRSVKELDEYLELWDWDQDRHITALESSVAYSQSPYQSNVPERIKASNLGDYRFIYMLRDPLSRIESQVRHGLFAGWGKDLDEGGVTNELIKFSSYASQIEKYLEYFPKESILLITLEEFNKNPESTLKKVCGFIGIDSAFVFKNVNDVRNSGEFFNLPSVVSTISQGGISQFVIQNILPLKIKRLIRESLAKLGKKKNSEISLGRWKLNDQEKQFIYSELKNDFKKLKIDHGVDAEREWNVPHVLLR